MLVPRNLLQPEGSISDVIELSLFLVGAFGPTVAALVTQWLAYRNLKICHIWTGWKALVVGLAAGVSCFVIATVICPALSLVRALVKELDRPALAHLAPHGSQLFHISRRSDKRRTGLARLCPSKTPTTVRSLLGDADYCPVMGWLAHPGVLFARLGYSFPLAVLTG